MNVPQLKLLAARLRGLLEQHSVVIGHSQSLDLIAALPGLRNWPEVNAFPQHVETCELLPSSVSRLAHRLSKRHGLKIDPNELLEKLSPIKTDRPLGDVPDLWPSGPKPGVYLTTSQKAIDELMVAYDDATDGELIYAEHAGDHFESTISLGETGLWSPGLSRAPSGTLLIVGPLLLTQEEWTNSAKRLQQACILAMLDGYRVAVLVNTPAPEQLNSDALLLVKCDEIDLNDLHHALLGLVTESGDLKEITPFATKIQHPPRQCFTPVKTRLPKEVELELQAAVKRSPFGIILFGSNDEKSQRSVWIESLLPLTEISGPVARIRQDDRHDDRIYLSPSAPLGLVPVMPSIESAYAHGYRRIIIDDFYKINPEIIKYSRDVCFIMTTYQMDASGLFDRACDFSDADMHEAIKYIISIITLSVFESKNREVLVSDMYTNRIKPPLIGDHNHIINNRFLRWEDGLNSLLKNKSITESEIKKTYRNNRSILNYLAERKNKVEPIQIG